MQKTLSLYRTLLRTASCIPDIGFRCHAMRRIRYGFKRNSALSGEEAETAYQNGLSDLAMVRRQVTLCKLYPETASVVESYLAVGSKRAVHSK